jgi:hypothetical protein
MVYNIAMKCVHMSRDAIFEEDHAWGWDEEDNSDGEPFNMEFVPVGSMNCTGDVACMGLVCRALH